MYVINVYMPTNILFVCVNRRMLYTVYAYNVPVSSLFTTVVVAAMLMPSQWLGGHAHNATLSLAATTTADE